VLSLKLVVSRVLEKKQRSLVRSDLIYFRLFRDSKENDGRLLFLCEKNQIWK
jgi:hypothetical protein